MSSNFLQRFKGKTQQISKDGVTNILGSKNPDSVYNPNQAIKERNFNSVNNTKNTSKNQTKSKIANVEKKPTSSKAASSTVKSTQKKTENPFLVSNPFYLDEQQRERQELQKREKRKLEQQIRKAELKQQQQQKDPKDTTKTSSYARSQEKKKGTGKEWVKLGGLGANIGGDEWLQKKKKLQKMQEFSGQVKNVNAERVRPPRPDAKKQQLKEPNSRQKALQYSKNVPKPVIRRAEPEEQQQRFEKNYNDRLPEEEQLTELQLYEMKHEQLKKMIHNQY